MDNDLINICISPQSGHYQTSLVLQHLKLDENGFSLAPTMFTVISTYGMERQTHLPPINAYHQSCYKRKTEFFVNTNINAKTDNMNLY